MNMCWQVLHDSSLRWHYPGQVQRVEGPLPLLSVRHAGPNSPLEFSLVIGYGVTVPFVNNATMPCHNASPDRMGVYSTAANRRGAKKERHPCKSVTQMA
jgi:hypothetical protein